MRRRINFLKTPLITLFVILISLTSYGQSEGVANSSDTAAMKPVRIVCAPSYKKYPRPLVFIDGKRKRRISKKIKPEDIEHIELIKGADVELAKYGKSGRHGVILITTRKNRRAKSSV